MGVPEAEKTDAGGCNSMSDHFKFDVMVTITDRWELGFGQKERGDENHSCGGVSPCPMCNGTGKLP